MNIEYLPVSAITPYERNAKKHPADQVAHIANSIREFGFRQPLVVDAENVLVIGHGRLLAAKKLGMKEVPVVRADDLTPEQIKALRLADNKTNESEWDDDLLGAELGDILDIDMNAFGFDLSESTEDEVIEDEYDEAPPEEPKSKPGDIYQLGDHRLMCGDSTNADDMKKLMGEEKAKMTVTSPPYGVGKSYEEKGITPWFDTMRPVIANITEYSDVVCWNLGDLLTTGTQYIEPTSLYSEQLFDENGFKPIWIRVWEKQGMNFGVGPYHLVTNKPVQQYEYIQAYGNENTLEEYDESDYMWLTAYARHAHQFVKRLSREERRKWGYAGIWKINTVKANKEHPAMFPVELPWRCIKMHSDKGDVVIEPFDGSGTTIIACEQLERKCYAMERDPKYVDLAIDRWEKFTGRKAKLIESR